MNVKKKNDLNEIKEGQHVFIAGRTGSGKSYLAEVYLAGYRNVICLDTKGQEDWSIIPDIQIFDRLEDLMNFGEGKAIYRPRWEELNFQFYELFFEWIYKRQNTVVWIDEVMSICETANTIPRHYKACLTRGRSLGISVWSLTQRPKTIPLVIMSESSHFFVFDLNLEADRKRIMEVVPYKEILERPSEYGNQYNFWYYNFKMDKPVLACLK